MRESVVDAVGSAGPATSTAVGQIDHHSFEGTPREVAVGLYALPSRLVRRTFYALLLQGERQAEIRICERAAAGDQEARVSVWEGDSLGDLGEVLAAHCHGREPDSAQLSPSSPDLVAAVDRLLRAHGEFTEVGSVPAPPTARGAFGHPMRHYAGDQVVRAVVVAGDRTG